MLNKKKLINLSAGSEERVFEYIKGVVERRKDSC